MQTTQYMARFSLFFLLLLLLLSACKKEETSPIPKLPIILNQPIEIELNPNLRTPLAAAATIRTETPVQVKVMINGADPVEHQFLELEKEQTIPILGLYPDTTNQVVFQLTNSDQLALFDTVYIQTDPIPNIFPTIQINSMDRNRMEPGWTLTDFLSGKNSHYDSYPFIFDNQGVIRWYINLSHLGNLTMPIVPLKNGNLLFAYRFIAYEYDMLGQLVQEWDLGQFRQHHDILVKENGNLLIAVNNTDLTTISDHVIELDRSSGAVVHTWDFRNVLDMDRYVISSSSIDWFHMNSVWPDESDGGIVASGKHQGVVKVDAENQLKWIFAPHADWGLAGPNGDGLATSDYLLTAINQNGEPYSTFVQMGEEAAADFDWGWGQHAAMLLENGNLLIFDNGHPRFFNDDPTDSYSRMAEYEIDPVNMTVRQVWEFGKEYGEDLHSIIVSDVDEHATTGNRMMSPGIIWDDGNPSTRMVEVTYPQKEVVFDVSLIFSNVHNTVEYIWHRFDLTYRSERTRLYR